jgi:hypothetical protein
VIVVEPPAQIATSEPALIGAFPLTVTVTRSLETHPSKEVPVTVYVVVVPFTKFTLGPVVALKNVAGDQVYVLAPDAVIATVPPVQTETSLATTGGKGLIVTVPEPAKLTQPVAVFVIITL